ncbi:hypothetical protein NUW58_g10772 [Xylaria curta]|uniref:Uncharacterized protein n=1 Tax=Xylaria curta TaxID=42375 RepID=A0ACC1MH74_9PEZI|nr:hypothetical protein NUW58_g10772 [Xylaria curta]
MYRTQPPAPLDLSLGVTGKGDFFVDMPYTPTNSAEGKGLLVSPLGSEVLGPVIRDFDELDSVVEESAGPFPFRCPEVGYRRVKRAQRENQ